MNPFTFKFFCSQSLRSRKPNKCSTHPFCRWWTTALATFGGCLTASTNTTASPKTHSKDCPWKKRPDQITPSVRASLAVCYKTHWSQNPVSGMQLREWHSPRVPSGTDAARPSCAMWSGPRPSQCGLHRPSDEPETGPPPPPPSSENQNQKTTTLESEQFRSYTRSVEHLASSFLWEKAFQREHSEREKTWGCVFLREFAFLCVHQRHLSFCSRHFWTLIQRLICAWVVSCARARVCVWSGRRFFLFCFLLSFSFYFYVLVFLPIAARTQHSGAL